MSPPDGESDEPPSGGSAADGPASTDAADSPSTRDEATEPRASVNGGDDLADPAATRTDAPPPRTPPGQEHEDEEVPWSLFVRDLVGSVLAVGIVGVLLFAASGVWPPMVAIESQSMTPHLEVGDLVFVMDEQRFAHDAQHGSTGVAPAQAADDVGYVKFSQPGDVVVYAPNGNEGVTPIIHRARFWVEAGENWYDEADQRYVGGADDCEALPNCPAPHAGFITKGDANPRYDQAGPSPFSGPVKPAWIVGTAEARIPLLGCVRLASQPTGPRCNLLTAAPAASATPVGANASAATTGPDASVRTVGANASATAAGTNASATAAGTNATAS